MHYLLPKKRANSPRNFNISNDVKTRLHGVIECYDLNTNLDYLEMKDASFTANTFTPNKHLTQVILMLL